MEFAERVKPISLPVPFQIGQINVYLIEGGRNKGPSDSGGLTLIDTGMNIPPCMEELTSSIKQYGYGLKDIETIIITHSHLDHWGAAAQIKRLSGAQVMAHELEVPFLQRSSWGEGYGDNFPVLDYFRRWGLPPSLIESMREMDLFRERLRDPVKVDRALKDGEFIPTGGRELEVLHLPGHAHGLICLYEQSSRLFFSSDLLLKRVTPVPLLLFPWVEVDHWEEAPRLHPPKPKSLKNFLHSLERVERMKIELVLPSHGEVIDNYRTVIGQYRIHHQVRMRKIKKVLQEGEYTPYELSRKIFGRQANISSYLTMSEVIGHLEILEEGGEVGKKTKGGVEYYFLEGK